MTAFESRQVVVGILQAVILFAALLGALYVGLKQNEINRNLLDLHYAVAVEVTYHDKQINVVNKGQTNLWLWGTQLGSGPKRIEQEPRLITPGGFYYLLAEALETEILQKVGQNGQTVVPLEIFLESQNRRKHIVKTLLFVVVTEGKVTVHTQTVSATRADWSS